MFERVLFPTDFSESSQKVLECVKDLPGVKNVVLLHVISPDDPTHKIWDSGGRIDEASAKLHEQKELLEGGGFDIKTRITTTEGEISSAIQRVAEEQNSTVVVMGARGKGIIKSIFLGSVAKNVLRNGNTNLLLMRYAIFEDGRGSPMGKICSRKFSEVLCPTDLSDTAEEAIAIVKCIPGIEKILLQHVVFSGETMEEVESLIQEANNRLNAIRESLENDGLKANTYVSIGNPAEEIIDLAKKEDVSLIAMSSYGKDWLRQLVIGSTTYEVARMGDRPVLVIRSGSECLK